MSRKDPWRLPLAPPPAGWKPPGSGQSNATVHIGLPRIAEAGGE